MKKDSKKLKSETKSKNKKVERFLGAWDKLFGSIIESNKLEKGLKK